MRLNLAQTPVAIQTLCKQQGKSKLSHYYDPQALSVAKIVENVCRASAKFFSSVPCFRPADLEQRL
jgi:hypothetical protein